MKEVNLSRRPFVNSRPVVRLAALLWIVGVVLCALNVSLYGTYWIDSAELRGRLADVNAEIDSEQKTLASLAGELKRQDLQGLDAHARFLNGLIDDRLFPWSELFDDLERVLPIDVRLRSVQPTVRAGMGEESDRRSARRSRGSRTEERPEERSDKVQLVLVGASKGEDALMEFVDNLYGDPEFLGPLLGGEQHGDDGMVRFTISVRYLTRPPAPAADEPADEGEVAAAGEAGPAAEASAAGTPAAGTPAAGTSGAATTAAGTPAAGTPAAGMPAAGTSAAEVSEDPDTDDGVVDLTAQENRPPGSLPASSLDPGAETRAPASSPLRPGPTSVPVTGRSPSTPSTTAVPTTPPPRVFIPPTVPRPGGGAPPPVTPANSAVPDSGRGGDGAPPAPRVAVPDEDPGFVGRPASGSAWLVPAVDFELAAGLGLAEVRR